MKKAIGFKNEFRQPILDGVKLSTIRGPWEKPAVPGLVLSMWTGLRTQGCEHIADKELTIVREIHLTPSQTRLGDRWLNHEQAAKLASIEGFQPGVGFWDFFLNQYGLPWDGVWMYWGDGDPFK